MSAQLLQDEGFITDLRQQMYRFALQQLGCASLAEDAVQDAFAGAYKNAQAFQAKAAVKTWVFAILKNKIADSLRRKKNLIPLQSLDENTALDDEDAFNDLFNPQDHWRAEASPTAWGSPDKTLQNEHFWRVFDSCLNHLPAKPSQVFMLREILDFSTPDICAQLGLTEANVHVLLYRARVRLRECLENNWFAVG